MIHNPGTLLALSSRSFGAFFCSRFDRVRQSAREFARVRQSSPDDQTITRRSPDDHQTITRSGRGDFSGPRECGLRRRRAPPRGWTAPLSTILQDLTERILASRPGERSDPRYLTELTGCSPPPPSPAAGCKKHLLCPYLRSHALYIRSQAPYLRSQAPYLRSQAPYLRTLTMIHNPDHDT